MKEEIDVLHDVIDLGQLEILRYLLLGHDARFDALLPHLRDFLARDLSAILVHENVLIENVGDILEQIIQLLGARFFGCGAQSDLIALNRYPDAMVQLVEELSAH